MRHALLLLLTAASSHLQAQSTLEVRVELNQPEAGGMVRIALCKGAEAFDKVQGCRDLSVPADRATVVLVFPDIPPGEYAIKAFHDVNGNGEMDFTMIGLPKEPYGFSNSAMGTFGPPSFKQASFPVAPGRNSTVFRMRG
jgi:uncharacterized protein (DUF2141 family)